MYSTSVGVQMLFSTASRAQQRKATWKRTTALCCHRLASKLSGTFQSGFRGLLMDVLYYNLDAGAADAAIFNTVHRIPESGSNIQGSQHNNPGVPHSSERSWQGNTYHKRGSASLPRRNRLDGRP